MKNTDKIILLVRSVFQERYLSGNAIAKNLSIVAEVMIKPVEIQPTLATYIDILHEKLFMEKMSGKPNFSSQYSLVDVNNIPTNIIESDIEIHFRWLPMEVEKSLLIRNIIRDNELNIIPRGIKIIRPYMWMCANTLSFMDFADFSSSVAVSSLMFCPKSVVVSVTDWVKFSITLFFLPHWCCRICVQITGWNQQTRKQWHQDNNRHYYQLS